MTKTVPVVYYIRGERRVIGEAVVDLNDFPVTGKSEINLNNAGISDRKDS